ncbi:hypothetical protein ACM66B_005965 [Microbotryomycetes sp. NB124-2]
MSRHRAVKNLDLDDELDDEAIDSGGEDYYDDMTDEQAAQMASALSAVHQLLGPTTPISDKDIKDALWDSYFDVDGTVAYLLDEQHKKQAAKAKAQDSIVPLQELPVESMADLSIGPSSPPSSNIPSEASFVQPRSTSKLAAKMAANKAARTAKTSSSSENVTSSPTTAVESPPTAQVENGKKLSKLQQRMLASKAAKAAGISTRKASAQGQASSAPVEQPTSTQAEAETAQASPSAPPLLANPSPFASSLVTRAKPFLSGEANRIEHSFVFRSVAAGAAPGNDDDLRTRFGPSPDDKVLEARKGTTLAQKVSKANSQPASARNSRPSTPNQANRPTISGGATNKSQNKQSSSSLSTKPVAGPVSQLRQDLEGMNLVGPPSASSSTAATRGSSGTSSPQMMDDFDSAPTPPVMLAKDKLLEQVKLEQAESNQKPVLSLVVVGHVDAGKSTLMGRVLHELGEVSDKSVEQNQRQSAKIGKGSFAYAWTFDALDEERERGVTIDVAIDSFSTQHRRFTLIDAPGHRDFIPNMISGAAQADTAVLVVDGSSGAFERGFEGGGQTREHAVLVRSLGVQQLVVAVNKLDAVGWAQSRFESIREQLRPFLTQLGFQPSKVAFVPVGAMSGENIVTRTSDILNAWYEGPTLVEQLDSLDVPKRALDAPLRIPVSNVFRGQSATASGLAVSGRVETGIVQAGERLCALPGDESGVVRALEVDGELVPYAVAGSNITVFLSGIDILQLNVGSVLCPPHQPVPVASSFTAQIMVFDLKYPMTAGYSVELFHHSKDIPATITSLEAVLDKTTGAVTKTNPRMITKNSSARVTVQLRPLATGSTRRTVIPIEPFSVNKSMGRVLFRRAGETVAAGIVLEVL